MPQDFHVPLRLAHRPESKLLVKAVGIDRHQHPPAQALQVWVRHDGSHQRFAQALAAMFRQHKHIAQIGERRPVGNHPRKANLDARTVNSPNKANF